MTPKTDVAAQIEARLDELEVALAPSAVEQIRASREACRLVQAVRTLCAHLVNQQVPISSDQRSLVADLLETVKSVENADWASSKFLDPAWVLPRLYVDGVRSAGGAEIVERHTRVRAMAGAIDELVERFVFQLEPDAAGELRRHHWAGQWGMAITDLIGGLIDAGVRVTPAERDELARVRELAVSLNDPSLVLDAGYLAQLNVVEGDTPTT